LSLTHLEHARRGTKTSADQRQPPPSIKHRNRSVGDPSDLSNRSSSSIESDTVTTKSKRSVVRIQTNDGNRNAAYSQTKADIRQSERLEKALEVASATIGTSKNRKRSANQTYPDRIQAFLPAPIEATEGTYHDTTMILKIRAITMTLPTAELSPGPFQFQLSLEAASHNHKVLEQHNFLLQQCIESYPNS
jgi:hypothetical protein